MRVLVPRRFIRLGVLLAVLCLTPAISPSAFALPRPFKDLGDENPPPPKGDGDGTIVKGATMQIGISYASDDASVGDGMVTWANVAVFQNTIRRLTVHAVISPSATAGKLLVARAVAASAPSWCRRSPRSASRFRPRAGSAASKTHMPSSRPAPTA